MKKGRKPHVANGERIIDGESQVQVISMGTCETYTVENTLRGYAALSNGSLTQTKNLVVVD